MLRPHHHAILAALAALLAACQGSPQPDDAATATEPVLVVQDFPTAGVVSADDGTAIAYSSQGSGDTALVFLHGWSCDRTYWRHQLEPFARDHRVVSVDLAGHGDSGAGRSQWRLQTLGEDVRAVVEELGLTRVVLVGHSMGGPVALEAARRLPGKVLGVVGIDSLHDVDQDIDGEQWQGLMGAYRQDFKGTCDRFVRSMFLEDAEPELVLDIVQDMCAAPPEIAVQLLEQFPDYDMEAALGKAGAPVHVINAASYPTDVAGNRQTAGTFEAVIMEGVGHFLMLERPEEFNTHLRATLEALEGGGTSS